MSSRYHRRSVSGFNIVVQMLRPSDPAIDCIAWMAKLKVPLSWTLSCPYVCESPMVRSSETEMPLDNNPVAARLLLLHSSPM
jgi:hypothetical protein